MLIRFRTVADLELNRRRAFARLRGCALDVPESVGRVLVAEGLAEIDPGPVRVIAGASPPPTTRPDPALAKPPPVDSAGWSETGPRRDGEGEAA